MTCVRNKVHNFKPGEIYEGLSKVLWTNAIEQKMDFLCVNDVRIDLYI